MSTTDSLTAPTRADWRQWLANHHDSETNVWLRIYRKNGNISSVTYSEAVDEALCFGWIDSTARKGDETYHLQYFARRKPKSNWSRVNKEKVARLTADGLMTPAGQKLIDLAKETGTWTALDELEDGTAPPDLQTAFDANPTAQVNFNAFPRSVKRGILEWLLNAKTGVTRQKRIADIVAKAQQNERANQYGRK